MARKGAAEAAQVAADAALQRQELELAQEPEPQPRYTRPQARRASSAPAVIRTFPAEASSSGKAYYVLRRDQPRGVAVVAGQTKVQVHRRAWDEATTPGRTLVQLGLFQPPQVFQALPEEEPQVDQTGPLLGEGLCQCKQTQGFCGHTGQCPQPAAPHQWLCTSCAGTVNEMYPTVEVDIQASTPLVPQANEANSAPNPAIGIQAPATSLSASSTDNVAHMPIVQPAPFSTVIRCTGGCGRAWRQKQDVPYWSKRKKQPWCPHCGADQDWSWWHNKPLGTVPGTSQWDSADQPQARAHSHAIAARNALLGHSYSTSSAAALPAQGSSAAPAPAPVLHLAETSQDTHFDLIDTLASQSRSNALTRIVAPPPSEISPQTSQPSRATTAATPQAIAQWCGCNYEECFHEFGRCPNVTAQQGICQQCWEYDRTIPPPPPGPPPPLEEAIQSIHLDRSQSPVDQARLSELSQIHAQAMGWVTPPPPSDASFQTPQSLHNTTFASPQTTTQRCGCNHVGCTHVPGSCPNAADLSGICQHCWDSPSPPPGPPPPLASPPGLPPPIDDVGQDKDPAIKRLRYSGATDAALSLPLHTGQRQKASACSTTLSTSLS